MHRLVLAWASLAAAACIAPAPRGTQSSFLGVSLTHDRLGTNVWNDEARVYELSAVRYEGTREDGRALEIAPPPWSHDGMAVRIVTPIGAGVVYRPEIHVATITTSGLRLKLSVNGAQLPCWGAFRETDWYRFRIPEDDYAKAISEGMLVRVDGEGVSEPWTFPLAADYFRGFTRRVEQIVDSEKLTRSPDYEPSPPLAAK